MSSNDQKPTISTAGAYNDLQASAFAEISEWEKSETQKAWAERQERDKAIRLKCERDKAEIDAQAKLSLAESAELHVARKSAVKVEAAARRKDADREIESQWSATRLTPTEQGQAQAERQLAKNRLLAIPKIRRRYNLKAADAPGMIEELKTLAAENRKHNAKESRNAAIDMDQAIIELGGVPGEPSGVSASHADHPSDAEMERLLGDSRTLGDVDFTTR